jgi:hypothetical protein
MGGNVPEEDGVDHRVEPRLWLTDGSEEGASGGPGPVQATPADPPGDPSRLADLPLPGDAALPHSSNGTAGQDVPFPGQGVTFSRQEIPYPGQDIPYTGQQAAVDPAAGPPVQENSYSSPAATESSHGLVGQDTQGPGDGLRIPPYQPQVPPYPAQVPPAPSPGVASRVTAPFAALTKAKPKAKKPARPAKPVTPPPAALKERAAAKTGNVPRGAAPTRRAQLVLSRVEPWSVMKFSFMVSLVGWVILFVAVAALYYVLNRLGVFHSIQSTISDVTSSKGSTGADANGQWFSASRILGYTMLIGAVNVVLITALATVGAVIYNLVTHLAGGIEVTLKETD